MIDNRKQFLTEVLLCVASNKITQQKLGYNCKYPREDILADSYVSVFNSLIFSLKLLFDLKSSIARIIYEAKEAPEACQTSANNFFTNFFSNVILVVWRETYFDWKLFAFLFKLYIKETQIWDTLPKSKKELFVTLGICKLIFCKLMICTHSIALWVCLFCVSSLPVPFYSGWFHANIWDDAFCDHNYCKCCVLLGNGIARAVSFYEFLVFLCQFVAKSISFGSSHQSCSVEKVFLESLQNPQKTTCGRVPFIKVANLKPATLLKKRLWHRPFPVNFVKYIRTPYFTEHLWWLLLLVTAG